MFSPQIEWSCSECQSTTIDRRKYCTNYNSMLIWTCTRSGKSGLYVNLFRHRNNCIHWTVELEDKPEKVEEKHIAIQQLQALDSEQRPWSEWSRTDESCAQHTGHDIQQVQQLYSMCKQPLIYYCLHRTKQQSNNINASLLSPMSLLVVTLWYYDFRHRIVHASKCYHGNVHDITVLRDSGLLEYVNDSVHIIVDKGYIGEEYIDTPRKKPHGRELTDEDTNFNHDINSARAAIENINQRLKTYAILGDVYRGAIDDFHKATKIVQVVSALCNLNLNKHPIRR